MALRQLASSGECGQRSAFGQLASQVAGKDIHGRLEFAGAPPSAVAWPSPTDVLAEHERSAPMGPVDQVAQFGMRTPLWAWRVPCEQTTGW